MNDEDKWRRRYERERKARKQAEHLLECKSLELYQLNEKLAQQLQAQGSQLLEKEELFASIFHASMDGIILLDDRGRVVEVNRAALRMLGYAREQLINRGVTRLVFAGGRRAAVLAFREVETTGYCRHETHLLRQDRTMFPVEVVGSHTEVGGKKVIQGILRDMTQRNRVLEDLQRARDLAQQASEAKSSFLATMSHEIRTPLNGILGFTELLLHSELSTEQLENLRLVQSSGNVLLQIINDLLDFSRIESGQLVLENVNYDLIAMLEEVLNFHRKSPEGRNLKLSLSVGEGVPRFLVGDIVRVRQVVTNLVSNAVKFTERGYVAVEVLMDGPELRIEVRDSGIGFNETFVDTLFEAFSQEDPSTTRKYGGTGLGLSICKRLAHVMGGDISASAEPGRGATFVFSLIPEISEEKVDGIVTGEVSSKETVKEVRGKILVAEDQPINARLVRLMLERLSYEVDVVENGRCVLDKLRESAEYSVILMDLHMHEMDGLETTRRIRDGEVGQEAGSIPIIAVTASALPEDRARCAEAGMGGFLAKPLRPADLASELERLL